MTVTLFARIVHISFCASLQRQCEAFNSLVIIIIKHVLIKVTFSCQRHYRGTAQSLTSKKEQAEALIAGGRRQTIIAV